MDKPRPFSGVYRDRNDVQSLFEFRTVCKAVLSTLLTSSQRETSVLIFASNITLTGSILANNTAASGGSIYLTDNSTLSLNRTSLFLNNTSSKEVMGRKILSCNNINSMRRIKHTSSYHSSYNSGGAIVCNNSYLDIY